MNSVPALTYLSHGHPAYILLENSGQRTGRHFHCESDGFLPLDDVTYHLLSAVKKEQQNIVNTETPKQRNDMIIMIISAYFLGKKVQEDILIFVLYLSISKVLLTE